MGELPLNDAGIANKRGDRQQQCSQVRTTRIVQKQAKRVPPPILKGLP
jgi:hypothetical protein